MKIRAGILCLLVPFGGLAGEYDYDISMCRNGLFPSFDGVFSAARVTAGGKTAFNKDSDGCPDRGDCKEKAYLIKNDVFLVAQEKENWVCAWYNGKKREFVGWLPRQNLEQISVKIVNARDFVGTWQPVNGSDNRILISLTKKGAINIRGNAVWYGGINSYGEQVVHVGQLASHGTLRGNVLSWDSSDDVCAGRMTLVNGSLIVTDNGECGGMNVRFDDVYRQRP